MKGKKLERTLPNNTLQEFCPEWFANVPRDISQITPDTTADNISKSLPPHLYSFSPPRDAPFSFRLFSADPPSCFHHQTTHPPKSIEKEIKENQTTRRLSLLRSFTGLPHSLPFHLPSARESAQFLLIWSWITHRDNGNDIRPAGHPSRIATCFINLLRWIVLNHF